jgi:regulator of sigma E protease
LIEKIFANDVVHQILIIIIVLGVSIIFHEFGHFAMAKLLKIRVMVFSLGFGPKLIGFTRGGTDYRLSYFPIGGYVKMAGELPDEEREGASDEFLSHPKWHRFLVAISGPFMNILLAVIALTFVYMHYGAPIPREPKKPIVGQVTADPAKSAGLQSGDLITSVYRNRVTTWEEVGIALETAPRDALDIEVLRNNQTEKVHFNLPAKEQNVNPITLGFKPIPPKTYVYDVDKKLPAYKAGLKVGDEILSVRGNNKVGTNYEQILAIIPESKGIPLTFEVRRPDVEPQKEDIGKASESRNSKIISLTITPIEDNGRVVIGFIHVGTRKLVLVEAFPRSIRDSCKQMAWTFTIIGRILIHHADVRTIAGPIGIAKMSGDIARERNPQADLTFLFIISLSLGVFNLLPIPILDGGVIALLAIEGIIRRDLSLRLKEKIVQVGLVFLIILMCFVVFNDISKIVHFR